MVVQQLVVILVLCQEKMACTPFYSAVLISSSFTDLNISRYHVVCLNYALCRSCLHKFGEKINAKGSHCADREGRNEPGQPGAKGKGGPVGPRQSWDSRDGATKAC